MRSRWQSDSIQSWGNRRERRIPMPPSGYLHKSMAKKIATTEEGSMGSHLPRRVRFQLELGEEHIPKRHWGYIGHFSIHWPWVSRASNREEVGDRFYKGIIIQTQMKMRVQGVMNDPRVYISCAYWYNHIWNESLDLKENDNGKTIDIRRNPGEWRRLQ